MSQRIPTLDHVVHRGDTIGNLISMVAVAQARADMARMLSAAEPAHPNTPEHFLLCDDSWCLALREQYLWERRNG